VLATLLALVMHQTSTSSVGALIPATDPRLQYSGRIDFDEPTAPVFCFGGCGFRTRFEGSSLALKWSQDPGWANSIGVRIDGGTEIRIALDAKGPALYQVAVGLASKTHDLYVYRRSDPWGHLCTFQGLVLDKGCGLLPPPPRPKRQIEFYGDSVTAGTLVEAVGYEGLPDTDIKTFNEGEQLTNAYWSYAFIAARSLRAEAQIVAVGGLALHDANGWYPLGLATIFDKAEALPDHMKPWDFKRFNPQVVVVAIGQNDARFENIHDPVVRTKWIADYQALLDHLRTHYPDAWFVLTTTVLGHDLAWDDALKEIAASRHDRVRYYGYRRAGRATPGHPRLAEHQEMAAELAGFIQGLPSVWQH